MKIGILEAGLVRESLADQFDPYPAMFERFLGQSGRDLEFDAVSYVRGEIAGSIHDCDGWLITGSRYGVYENLDWIASLQDFVRELAEARVPLVGICFGHQIIAQALGGKVVKSEKGWGVGLHRYRVEQAHLWMDARLQHINMHSFHQDQVVECPPSAQVLLSSEFCPYAGLTYDDTIISVQGHPEMEAAYLNALLDLFSGSTIPAEDAAQARNSMTQGLKPDDFVMANWIAEFFLSSGNVSAASRSASGAS